MPIIAYMRVSTRDQTCENQRKVIDQYLKQNRFDLGDVEYVEEVESSAKTRPKKSEVMDRMRKCEIDCIIVVRLDRFARSTSELIQDIEQILDNKCRFVCIQQGWDFSDQMSATQKLTFTVFGAFAEFERELIRERINEGLARAKARGKKLGRPKGSSDAKKRNRRFAKNPYR